MKSVGCKFGSSGRENRRRDICKERETERNGGPEKLDERRNVITGEEVENKECSRLMVR